MKFVFWTDQSVPIDERRVLGFTGKGNWQKDKVAYIDHVSTVCRAFSCFKTGVQSIFPVIGRHGTVLVSGHARLDHREELAVSLGLCTDQLRRYNDADLVLKAWEKWGEDAPRYLHGEFSLAVFDQKTQQTWLVADRMRLSGLFYHLNAEGLVASSSLQTFLTFPQIDRTLDPRYVAARLTDCVLDPEVTPYKSIKHLSWATIVRIGANGDIERRWRYWNPEELELIRFKSDDEYVEVARAHLDEAVRPYLNMKGPFVSGLTGGLDCASVIGTLQKIAPDRTVHALTSVSDKNKNLVQGGRLLDERKRASISAEHWANVDHELVHICEEENQALVNKPEATFLNAGYPLRNILNADWLEPLSVKSRDMGAHGLFVGAHGNVGFSWEGMSLIGRDWNNGARFNALKNLRQLRKNDPHEYSFARLMWREAIAPACSTKTRLFIRKLFGHGAWPEYMRMGFVNPDLADELDLKSYLEDANDQLHQIKFSSNGYAERLRRFTLDYDRFFPYKEYQAQRFGVVNMTPLANRRLLEFCFAIPQEQYFSKGCSRWLARRALADRMPAQTLAPQPRVKQGGNHYRRMTVQREHLYEELEKIEQNDTVSQMLNIAEIRRVLDDWPKNETEWLKKNGLSTYAGVHLSRALNMAQYIRWVEQSNS